MLRPHEYHEQGKTGPLQGGITWISLRYTAVGPVDTVSIPVLCI